MKLEKLWDTTLYGPVPTGARNLKDARLTRKRFERIVRQYGERQEEIKAAREEDVGR